MKDLFSSSALCLYSTDLDRKKESRLPPLVITVDRLSTKFLKVSDGVRVPAFRSALWISWLNTLISRSMLLASSDTSPYIFLFFTDDFKKEYYVVIPSAKSMHERYSMRKSNLYLMFSDVCHNAGIKKYHIIYPQSQQSCQG